MATTVDTLLVRIEADMKDIRRDLRRLEQTTKKSTDKMNKSFSAVGKVFKVAMVAVVVRQAAQAAIALTKLASGVEEMQAKSSVVFGQFADDFRAAMSELANETGRSRFELEAMGATVQDTFVPMGFAREEATELSKQLVKLAVDVASFNNKADTEVMEAFQSALVGNHETMRQFGVVITEATIKQELLNMGIEGGTKAASNSQKVQARLNLIMAGTADAQGDAVKTANSYANRVREMQSALNDLGILIGNELMPSMKILVTTITSLTKETEKFLKATGLIEETDEERLIRFSEAYEKLTTAIEKGDIEGMKAFNGELGLLGRAMQTVIGVSAQGLSKLDRQTFLSENIANNMKLQIEALSTILGIQAKLSKETAEFNELNGVTNAAQDRANEVLIEAAEKKLEAEKNLKPLIKASTQAMIEFTAEAHLASLFLDNLVVPSKEIVENFQAGGEGFTAMVLLAESLKNINLEIDETIEKNKQFLAMQGAAAGDRLQGQGMPFTPFRVTNFTGSGQGVSAMAAFEQEVNSANRAVDEAMRKNKDLLALIGAQAGDRLQGQGGTFTPTKTAAEQQQDRVNLLKEEIEQTMKLETAVFNMTVQNGEYGKNMLHAARVQQKMHELKKQDADLTHAQTHAIALLLVKQENLRASQAEQVAVFESFKNRIKEVGDELADSLAKAFMDGKLELSSFGNIFRSFIQDMIAQVIKLQVIAPIFNSLFGNNTTGGHFLGSLIKPQASGGTLTPNRPHLVGERGAELFVPSGAGTLLNNMNTKNAMSGASTIVNQSINLSTGVAQTVHAEVLNLLPAIKEQTMMAVSDSKRRGGAFAQVMG